MHAHYRVSLIKSDIKREYIFKHELGTWKLKHSLTLTVQLTNMPYKSTVILIKFCLRVALLDYFNVNRASQVDDHSDLLQLLKLNIGLLIHFDLKCDQVFASFLSIEYVDWERNVAFVFACVPVSDSIKLGVCRETVLFVRSTYKFVLIPRLFVHIRVRLEFKSFDHIEIHLNVGVILFGVIDRHVNDTFDFEFLYVAIFSNYAIYFLFYIDDNVLAERIESNLFFFLFNIFHGLRSFKQVFFG